MNPEPPLVIYGAGGHGRVVIDIALASQLEVAWVLDDLPKHSSLYGIPLAQPDQSRWRPTSRSWQFINHKKLKKKNYNYNQKFSMRTKDLFLLIDHVKKNHPTVKIIQMGSWLNKYKPFRTLFPKTWKSTNKIKKKNSIAWWGQFVDVTGNIHKKNANLFIKNFKFPYPGEFYQCNISELKKFVSFSIKRS